MSPATLYTYLLLNKFFTMHFTRFAPAAAGLIGAAQALLPGLVGDVDLAPAVFDCSSSWDDEVLFKGVVGAETETHGAINLGLNIKEAQIEGDISIEALEDFLKEPSLRLDLAGVKAYVELDISADAAVFQTVELVASPALNVDAGLLEVTLGAAFALDLIVAVDAAIDVSAGFYLSFQEGDYIDLSIITKEVVGSNLDGLVTKALPIGVGANVDLSAEIEVQLGLRLRSHIIIEAGIDLLGLDILNAGAEVAIWADLLTHTIVLVETDECILSVDNSFALALGIAVDLSVEVLDLLDIALAPEITVTLATALGLQVCLDSRGETGGFLNPQVESSSTLSTVIATPTGAPNATITSGGLITSTHSETKTYTITSCHASVHNCPASETQKIVTSTVISSVTVCPADQTDAPVPTSTKSKKPVHTITETLTTVVPCEPTSSTYTPPTTPPPAPTVTISDSITASVTKTEGEDEPPKPTGVPSTEVPEPTKPTEPEQPETPEEPTKPTEPELPTPPVTTPHEQPTAPPTVPSWTNSAPNSTWTSVVTPPPGSTWVPPPATTPTEPPTAGAGAFKVGIAMALPAVVAMML